MTEIPWRRIIPTLDTGSRGESYNAVVKTLDESGDAAPQHLAVIAPCILELESGPGRQLGARILARYMGESLAARDVVLTLSDDAEVNVRSEATSALLQIRDDPAAIRALYARLADDNDRVRNIAIGALPEIARGASDEAVAASLHVFPDADSRADAGRQLAELRAAVLTLQDLGLDDAQNRIVDDVILPRIDSLSKVFAAKAETLAEADAARESAALEAGKLMGSTDALVKAASVIAAVAQSREAVDNVIAAAGALGPIVGQLLQLAHHIR